MTDKTLLEQYGIFVDGVTSETSKDENALVGRIYELTEEGVDVARLLTAGIGLPDEAGEFSGLVKKIVFHGKPLTEANRAHLKKELGDVAWYWMQACLALDVDPNSVILENIEKLESRYPGGKFSVERSEVREEGDV